MAAMTKRLKIRWVQPPVKRNPYWFNMVYVTTFVAALNTKRVGH
jgi:hypothetical protein